MANENKKGPKAVKPYLSDLRDLSPEERRAFASKGGKASGKARQDKKTMKEILNALLDSKPNQKRLKDVKKKYPGIDVSNLTYRGIVGLAMLEKAVGAEEFVKADVSAAQWVRDTAGEKPVDIHKLEEPVVVKKVYVTPEEKAATARHIEEALRDGN